MEQHEIHFTHPRYRRGFRSLDVPDRVTFIEGLKKGLYRSVAVYRRKPAIELVGTNRKRGKRKYIGFRKNKSLSVIYIPGKHHVKAI